MTDWVIDQTLFTDSDHMCIRFKCETPGRSAPAEQYPSPEGWAVNKLDEGKLVDYIKGRKNGCDEGWLDTAANDATERFHQYVTAGCRQSMLCCRAADGHHPAYWWNDEIAEKRKLCIHKRRIFQSRGRRSVPRDEGRAEYVETKKDPRTAIKRSQEKAWTDLVSKVEMDIWGTPYRLVTKKLSKHSRNAYTQEREIEIA